TDRDILDFSAIIHSTGADIKGPFVVLNETAFYPQGGGQPADQGQIIFENTQLQVLHVAQEDSAIKHYIDKPVEQLWEGIQTFCSINKERRMLNTRYHTAAHLIGNIVEALYPSLKAIKGHSFPNEAYVSFEGAADLFDIHKVEAEVEKSILGNASVLTFETTLADFERRFYQLPYTITLNQNKSFRVVQIGIFSPIPCGGTHVSFLSEIGKIRITKAKNKGNIIRLSYEVL
ncbi:MAG: alanyl-tRNA editing protein, partial [Gammaproteobacteria bacterium]|nr:alanyl-tRNA editing protein [Gammaproteobacteria bacterium]